MKCDARAGLLLCQPTRVAPPILTMSPGGRNPRLFSIRPGPLSRCTCQTTPSAQAGGHRVVPYMQRQNDNLRGEFSRLLEDIDP